MTSHRFVDSDHVILVPAPPWSDCNFNAWSAGRGMDWHSHPYLQVIHVLEGAFAVDFGGGWRRLAAGCAHVLPPGRSHRLRSPGGQRQFGLNFRVERDQRGLLTALLAAFPEPTVLALRFAETWREALLATGGGATELRRLHALDGYCLALLERAAPTPADEARARLRGFIEEHLDRALPVDAVARALGLSRASAQRLCRRHFGCGIAHLHERIRLERAARALIGGDQPIAAVAAACGYGDVYGFSRAFRRVHGQPPAAWRRAARLGQA
jgi:AraC family transcriptional activator of mar-sox-rob regulon